MTTLSKEDMAKLIAIVGLDGIKSGDNIARFELLIEAARADLVAENERLKALSATNIMVDVVPGDGSGLEVYAKSVDEVVNLLSELGEKVEDLESVRVQLTATRTALAAAEAREKLQIDALLTCQKKQIINECAPSVNYKTFDSDLVAKALAQPRDGSTLREVIAGVYEECAKVCDLFEQKADALNDSIADDDDANKGRSEYIMGKATASSRIANAIRALAEKAKGG